MAYSTPIYTDQMKTFYLIVLLFIVCAENSFSINPGKIFFQPGFKIGYTFDAGLTYGFDIGIGTTQKVGNMSNLKTGLMYSYYWVPMGKYTHKIKTFNLFAAQEHFALKMGFGNVHYRRGRVVRCSTMGLNFDIAGNTGIPHTPWVGVNGFYHFSRWWPWHDMSYKTGYLKFQHAQFLKGTKEPVISTE